MANSSFPLGLIPRMYRNGSPWMGAMRAYSVPASDAQAIFPGDPVIIAGNGSTNGYSVVTRATAGATNRITGVMIGMRPTPLNQNIGYRRASVAEIIYVVDDPDVLFEVMEDSVGGSLAAANIGQNVDLIAAAGNTALNTSGWMLDSSTATAPGPTLQMRIMELQHREDVDFGTNASFLCAINLPTETGASGSSGV